jgi:hypothetical protein
MNSAAPLAVGTPVLGVSSAAEGTLYEVQPGADGRLIAQARVTGGLLQIRLALYDGQGNLLVQSDARSSAGSGPVIDEHVAAGADFLYVQGLSGLGTYALSTTLTPSSDPGETLALPANYQQATYAPIAVGDFTNNGIVDIVAPDGVHPGTGDGTFEAPAPGNALVDPTDGPSSIAVGDFNGDHKLDAAVALSAIDSVSVSLGNGDGTFQPATTYQLPAGAAPGAIVAGYFTGNGILDLAVADTGTNQVTILVGNGDGTFQVLPPISVGQSPISIAMGNFENNGRIDLAVANENSGDVTILSNQGGGNFEALAPIALPSGAFPTAIVAGNFGTGKVDLAVTDTAASKVDILTGNGHGGFAVTSTVAVGAAPTSIVVGNYGNNHVDLAVADTNSNDVSVLLGNGNGTFQRAVHAGTGNGTTNTNGVANGTNPVDLVAADFNGDGRLDVATGNVGSNDISVLLGKGNGTFEEQNTSDVGYVTSAVATGDFTDNGNLGLAVLNQASDTVSILPGNGDGTFQQALTVPLPAGTSGTSIVSADFNNDGRLDLAIAAPSLDEVLILLGNGDGTFDVLPPIPVTGTPEALTTGDFLGNGRADLAVADEGNSTVTILLNNGDGTFTPLKPIPLASPFSSPDAIVAGKFTSSGHVDLAVADIGTSDITILLGNGNGTFRMQTPIPLPGSPSNLALVAGDFRNDGRTDLAVASTDFFNGDSVDVLLGNGNGTFGQLNVIPLGYGVSPQAIVAGYFTNNGILDLATADANGSGTDDYSIYLGNGNGTFQGPAPYVLGGTSYSTAIATGDFAGDGRTDLSITRAAPDTVAVRLSNGDGTFSDPAVLDLVRRETPLVADVNGDGAPDVSVVDAAGNILYRAGRAGEPGSFAPPITVNPGDPSRDIAFVSTRFGATIASVDADDNAISFFVLRSTGFALVAKLATGPLPAQILSAKLNGNGIVDLIVRNAGNGTISVFNGDGHGWFLPPIELQAGLGASDLQVGDLHQDGLLDIVFTDRLSGEIGVLQNLGGGAFSPPVLYRAGPGPYGVTGTANPSAVDSLEGTTGVAVGTFSTGGLPSLVALDPGSNTFGLLSGLGGGLLSNPTYFQTPFSGLVVRAIDFNGHGLDGLAVLGPRGLYIYRPNGQGGFLPPTVYNVGFEPNGLTVADLNDDGKPDLLVSNPLGDVLVLVGNGDGTLQPVRNLDQQVSLAVYAPNGKTPAAFIFADQLTDQLVVRTVSGVTTVLGNASTGLIAPTAVALADLNGDGILDLVVANGGSNNVLVYPGMGNGAFGAALNHGNGFFTGTNPRGITVADVNGDGRPDLVIADEGSNDVSILINVKVGNSFTFEPGPRLKVGDGPVATVVTDALGNGVPDLFVANSVSNDVWMLQGLGNGFFNDQSPVIFPVGTNPSALFVGQFTTGSGPQLVTVNAGSDSLTLISGLTSASPLTQSISSGGMDPTAAFEVDLKGNGLDSLVVANNGDGNISLFQPGDDGLTLSSVLSESGLPNPSGLALASFSGSNLEFYATTEGEESASLLGFQLEESGSTSPGIELSSAGGSGQLLSLNETSVALVGTLLTLTLDLQTETQESAEAATAGVASSGSGGAGQSIMSSSGSRDISDLPGDTTDEAAATPPNPMSWARFVIGLDEAIEDLRKEADQRLFQEQQPAKTDPDTTLFQPYDTDPTPVKTSFRQRDPIGVSRTPATIEDRLDAVDQMIGSWERVEPATSNAIFPILPDSTITKRIGPSARGVHVKDRAELFAGFEFEPSRVDTSQTDRVATLAALSALAATARECLLRRWTFLGSAGSAPTPESRWDYLGRKPRAR